MTLERLVTWNARAGRRPADIVLSVRRLILDTDADALALFEARAYVPALRAALPSWRVTVKGSDVVLLTRHGTVPIRRAVPIRVAGRWWGPKLGIPHNGRTHLLVDVGRLDQPNPLRLILVHRIPGGPSGGTSRAVAGRNRPTWEAEHIRLALLADRPGSLRRGLLIAGDQNAETSDHSPTSPGGLADAIGARIVRTGAKVDWALARGVHVTGQRLGNYGSDHPAIAYSLKEKP